MNRSLLILLLLCFGGYSISLNANPFKITSTTDPLPPNKETSSSLHNLHLSSSRWFNQVKRYHSLEMGIGTLWIGESFSKAMPSLSLSLKHQKRLTPRLSWSNSVNTAVWNGRTQGTIEHTSVMTLESGILYDFKKNTGVYYHRKSGFLPYLGAQLGVAYVNQQNNTTTSSPKMLFQVPITLGGRYRISTKGDLFVESVFRADLRPDVLSGTPEQPSYTPTKKPIHMLNIQIGYRYIFRGKLRTPMYLR
ncbi:hypothetical protein [Algivirga pacifica]|uniref:Outer membrane protein beta-barrel domain-containing protein n=1 Tax=Algivirga pacifica TaxID=1162670 RepID=A0ABP9DPW0_9BACT